MCFFAINSIVLYWREVLEVMIHIFTANVVLELL